MKRVNTDEQKIAWIEEVAEDITERKVLEMEMQYHTTDLNRYALSLTQKPVKIKPALPYYPP
jgi:hypothetical protein